MTKIRRRSFLAITLLAGPVSSLMGCGSSKPENGTQGNSVLPKEATEGMDKAYERNRKVQAAKK